MNNTLYSLRKVLLVVLMFLGASRAMADVTVKESGGTTTVTSTDTTGVLSVPDWKVWADQEGYFTKTLTATVQVRRGSVVSFDWDFNPGYNYGLFTFSLDGTTLEDKRDADTGHFERLFTKAGKHTIKVEFTYFTWDGTSEATYARLSNFTIDHDAHQGEAVLMPFRTTTVTDGKFAEGTAWYRLKCGSSGNYLHVLDDNTVGATSEAQVDSSYYWAFAKEADGRIGIYNYKTGALNPLTVPERTAKTDVRMGGDGTDRSFLVANNGEGITFWLDGDTIALYTFSNKYKVYKATTIYKIYNTSAATRASVEYVGRPPLYAVEDVYFYTTRVDTLLVGDQTYTYWGYTPYNTTERDVTLEIDNPNVLALTGTYSESCYVKGVGVGEATLTVRSKSKPSLCDSRKFVVLKNQKVEAINLEVDTLRMKAGEMHPVKVDVQPTDAVDATYTWSNSRPLVATITKDGLVYAQRAGTTVLTATANDGGGAKGVLVVIVEDDVQGEEIAHSKDYVYATHKDGSLTAIPASYIESKVYSGQTLALTLTGGVKHNITDVVTLTDVCPVELPQFKSYKFNDKFNQQLFDAFQADEAVLGNDTVFIPVSGIGKRLTASFQLADSLTEVYVGDVRQWSKQTRQRFDHPITYTIAMPQWQEVVLVAAANGKNKVELRPFGRKTTVVVDWLTDHSTLQYGVPRIDIKLDGVSQWNGNTYIASRSTYRNATITIDGGNVFDSMEETPILIKGRGNTSWSTNYTHKNPYHFKFEEKHKPLGMKSGKHWLLIANAQTGSMMTNAIAHRTAQMMGVTPANHVVPVELYINGSYRGSYNLTERVGLGNNSIDLKNDSLAAVLELDTYTDESIINGGYYMYYLPVKLKDGYEETDQVHQDAYDAFSGLVNRIWEGNDYDGLIDVDKTAAFLLAQEFIANTEMKHPKSVFLYNENIYDCTDNVNDPTPWVFGPVWDCDWAFGYQRSQSYYVSNADMDFYADMGNSDSYSNYPREFWNALRHQSTAVDRSTYSLLYHFMTQGGLTELQEYVQDYYDFAAKSFTHNKNNATSSTDATNYKNQVATAQGWLAKRGAAIFSQLESYDLSDDEDADQHPTDDIAAPSVAKRSTKTDVIYDLSGRRINGKPERGVYVVNGSLMVF